MEAFDIVMMCIMIPGVALTLWAVIRLGSAGYSGIKGKQDREKDDRKEIRNYFLKHDDYVMDDRQYAENVLKKAKDYTPMNAAMKLGLEEMSPEPQNLSWRAWCVTGALARKLKGGAVSSKMELDEAFLSKDILWIYRAIMQTDSGIAEEKTYRWKKSEVRSVSEMTADEYGMGAENTDVKAEVRYLCIELSWGTETFRIPEGSVGDGVVKALENWKKQH